MTAAARWPRFPNGQIPEYPSPPLDWAAIAQLPEPTAAQLAGVLEGRELSRQLWPALYKPAEPAPPPPRPTTRATRRRWQRRPGSEHWR